MELVTLPEMSKGEWKIEKFTTDRMDFSSKWVGREVPVGRIFTRGEREGSRSLAVG